MLSALLTRAQTPTLQQVTTAGNTTTTGVIINSSAGLRIGVDSANGYAVSSHVIKPSPSAYRTVRFDASSTDGNASWEFYNSSTAKTLVNIKQNGMMGVGTFYPEAALHVTSVNVLANGNRMAAVLGNTYNDWTAFGGINGGKIRGSNEGYLDLETYAAGTNSNLYLNLSSAGNVIVANGGGKVGIGTVTPQAKLSVNGDIFAKKVKVTQAGWPDFVFETSYPLMELNSLGAFIRENKHLPGIPPAREVEKEGLDIGDNQAKMMQKIEELTLYILELNRKLEKQQEQLVQQQKQLETINAAK